MIDSSELDYSQIRLGVGHIILRTDTDRVRVLLGKRAGSHGAGLWACPGGKVEKWETSFQAAARETREECGTDMEFYSAVSGFKHWSDDQLHADDRHFLTLYEVSFHIFGEPKVMEPEKCSEWKWFGLRNLPEDLFPGTYQAINALDRQDLI